MLNRIPRWLRGVVLVLTLVALAPSWAAEPAQVRFSVGARGHAGQNTSFQVLPFDPPTVQSSKGYTPTVLGPVSAKPGAAIGASETVWTPPTRFTWDFGDGTAPVEVKDRNRVQHRFDEPGTYTVTLTAANAERVYGSYSNQYEVRVAAPGWFPVGGSPASEDGAVFDFTAVPTRPREDDNLFIWQFGDGKEAQGKSLLKVSHRYEAGGTYKGVLTQVDDQGQSYDKKFKVVVADSKQAKIESATVDQLPETVVDQFTGSYAGDLNGDFDAQVFGGGAPSIYLVQVKPDRCRIIFHAIQDDKLILIRGIFDLRDFRDGPARYQLSPTRLNVTFHAKPKSYRRQRSTFMGGALGQAMLDPSKLGAVGTGIVSKDRNFGWTGGQLELIVVPGGYVTGKLTGRLKSERNTKDGKETRRISIDTDFSFRIGLTPFVKAGCEQTKAPFEVKSTNPKDLSSHQGILGQRLHYRVRFTEPFDPASVGDAQFKIGYPDVNGRFVRVPGRLVVDSRWISFVSDKPMRPGVQYSAHLRTGEDGVVSLGGEPLADTDGSGWRKWKFSTRLDFSAKPGGTETLSCHVFQSVRDVPLIGNKPAVPRVYAGWSQHNDIHPNAQVRAFRARVSLVDGVGNVLASARHRFVRPDLWAKYGVDIRSAQHTAQVYGFIPSSVMPAFTNVRIEVSRMPDGPSRWMYNTACSTPIWPRQLKLTVQPFILMEGVLADRANRVIAIPFFQKLLAQVKRYGWQTLPYHEIDIAAPKYLGLDAFKTRPVTLDKFGLETGVDLSSVESQLRAKSHADIVLTLGSADVFGTGGYTNIEPVRGLAGVVMGVNIPGLPEERVVNGKPVTALMDNRFTNRRIHGIVHEFGHALSLLHRPIADWNYQRAPIIAMREASRSSGAAIWFDGIEAFRMASDGMSGWNVSSTEGNQSGNWLMPLMFPGTVDYRFAMPTYDNYRRMQKFLEKSSAMR